MSEVCKLAVLSDNGSIPVDQDYSNFIDVLLSMVLYQAQGSTTVKMGIYDKKFIDQLYRNYYDVIANLSKVINETSVYISPDVNKTYLDVAQYKLTGDHSQTIYDMMYANWDKYLLLKSGYDNTVAAATNSGYGDKAKVLADSFKDKTIRRLFGAFHFGITKGHKAQGNGINPFYVAPAYYLKSGVQYDSLIANGFTSINTCEIINKQINDAEELKRSREALLAKEADEKRKAQEAAARTAELKKQEDALNRQKDNITQTQILKPDVTITDAHLMNDAKNKIDEEAIRVKKEKIDSAHDELRAYIASYENGVRRLFGKTSTTDYYEIFHNLFFNTSLDAHFNGNDIARKNITFFNHPNALKILYGIFQTAFNLAPVLYLHHSETDIILTDYEKYDEATLKTVIQNFQNNNMNISANIVKLGEYVKYVSMEGRDYNEVLKIPLSEIRGETDLTSRKLVNEIIELNEKFSLMKELLAFFIEKFTFIYNTHKYTYELLSNHYKNKITSKGDPKIISDYNNSINNYNQKMYELNEHISDNKKENSDYVIGYDIAKEQNKPIIDTILKNTEKIDQQNKNDFSKFIPIALIGILAYAAMDR